MHRNLFLRSQISASPSHVPPCPAANSAAVREKGVFQRKQILVEEEVVIRNRLSRGWAGHYSKLLSSLLTVVKMGPMCLSWGNYTAQHRQPVPALDLSKALCHCWDTTRENGVGACCYPELSCPWGHTFSRSHHVPPGFHPSALRAHWRFARWNHSGFWQISWAQPPPGPRNSCRREKLEF